jgi:hypothetical protein
MIKTAIDLPPIMPKTWTKAREGLLAANPAVYICVILVVIVVSFTYELHTATIFSCQADGYNTDRYLAYCNGTNYADYEHGAFYFDLEPSVYNFARNADVLFLGDSRLQVAFSTATTANWFSEISARYYLLGFSYYENEVFAKELLRRIRPRARVYVINVGNFFGMSESPPVKTILHDPGARHQYEVKRLWQRVHELVCKTFSVLCGAQFVIFRSRETGAYYDYHTEGAINRKITPVSYDQAINGNVVNSNTAAAIDFLSRFAQNRCVILTMVPFVGTKIGNANAIAKSLGMKLVTPGNLEGLQTFDGYHLDGPSAQRWSQAFFQAAGPKIRSCLAEQGAATP